MKRSIHKAAAVFVLSTALIFSCIPVQAVSPHNTIKTQAPILQNSTRQIHDGEKPTEQVLGEYRGSPSALLSLESEKMLSDFGVSWEGFASGKAERVKDTLIKRTVTRVEFENIQVEFDEQGRIVSYRKNEDPVMEQQRLRVGPGTGVPEEPPVYMLTKPEDMAPYIEKMERMLSLDGYQLVECANDMHESIWTLMWLKNCGNGLLNPYDNVVASFDAEDGSLSSFGRNTVEPNTTQPLITAQQAVILARPVQDRFPNAEISEVELTFFRPNFYWEEGGDRYEQPEFIRLSFKITLEDSVFIYVDALTGEILGGDELQGSYAREMSADPTLYRITERVNRANVAFKRLGYTEPYGFQPHIGWVTEADVRWTINYPGSTGLYLACHGEIVDGIGYIKDNRNWRIGANTLDHAYHFVFLDACESSYVDGIDSWRTAFHIGGTGTAFVGWNVDTGGGISNAFNERFFRYVGYKPILKAVEAARQEVINAGYTECNPGFSGDEEYYGWTW